MVLDNRESEDQSFPRSHLAATRAAFVDAIEQQPRRSRRRAVLVVVAGVVVLGSAGTAVAVQLTSTEVVDRSAARCYTSASKNFGDDFPGTTIATASTSSASSAGVADALSTCSDLWAQGYLTLGSARVNTTEPTDIPPVPQLAACVLPNGQAGVFPGDPSTCQSLGLPTVAN